MVEHKKISDLVNIELIQSIQDKCSKAMGLAFVTVDYRGRPITRMSGFTDHCALGREGGRPVLKGREAQPLPEAAQAPPAAEPPSQPPEQAKSEQKAEAPK